MACLIAPYGWPRRWHPDYRTDADGTVTERYAYDANGNRTRFDGPAAGDSGYYDAQDRLTRYGSTTYVYTAAGELATRISGTDTTRYAYDPLGNLIRVQFQSGDSINYLIDGRNRRVGRKLNGTVTAPPVSNFSRPAWEARPRRAAAEHQRRLQARRHQPEPLLRD